MRRLRRFALAAFVFDTLLGIGVLLVAGEATGARETPPPRIQYVTTERGCVMVRATGEGTWRYEGVAQADACTAGGS